MTGTSPPFAETAFEKARRILGLGVQEAIAYATDQGLEMADIKAAALEVSDLLLKFGTVPKPAPPALKLKVVRAPKTQLRLPFDSGESAALRHLHFSRGAKMTIDKSTKGW